MTTKEREHTDKQTEHSHIPDNCGGQLQHRSALIYPVKKIKNIHLELTKRSG